MTDINQLESICLNIEHSFLADLTIEIISPNGQNRDGFANSLTQAIARQAAQNQNQEQRDKISGTDIESLSKQDETAGDRLDVVLSNSEAGTANLFLFAADGREVLSDNRRLNAGSNNLSLNLSTVPPGVYFLRVGEQVLRVVRKSQ